MARARNIKPGFFKNDELAECSPMARLLFIGLWTLADREGRLEDRSRRIRGEIFAFDNCDIDDLLAELIEREFVIRYEADGLKCLWIPKFCDHQRPHPNEKPSELPPYCAPKVESECALGDKSDAPRNNALCADILNPSNLNPSSLNPESLMAEESAQLSGSADKDSQSKAPEASPAMPAHSEPPSPAKPQCAEDVPVPDELRTPEFIEARNAWLVQRRRRRLSVRPEHVARQYERLLPLGPSHAAACLRYSVDNDYQGLLVEKFMAKEEPQTQDPFAELRAKVAAEEANS